MIEFQTKTVKVKRPVADVFAHVSAGPRQVEWSSAVEECRGEGFGVVSMGSRYVQTVKLVGRRIESTCQVSDLQPNRRIEFAAVSGPTPHRWDVELEPVDGATRITMHGPAAPGR